MRIGICIGHDAMAMVAVRTGSTPEVRACQVAQVADGKAVLAALKQFVHKHHLRGKQAVITLPSSEFDLHQLERPDVPEAELAQALRWKLKDMIEYPVSRAVVDVFPTAPGRHGNASSVFAVSADKDKLQKRVEQIKSAGLKLERIDIAVLAIRNLAMATLDLRETTGVLQIAADRSLLYIYQDETFYLYRVINFKAAQLQTESSEQRADIADQVALEIQRTMDYYDSHFGRAPVRHLYFLHDERHTGWLASGVGEQLGLNTEIFTHPLWSRGDNNPEAEKKGFHSLLPLALGGALG